MCLCISFSLQELERELLTWQANTRKLEEELGVLRGEGDAKADPEVTTCSVVLTFFCGVHLLFCGAYLLFCGVYMLGVSAICPWVLWRGLSSCVSLLFPVLFLLLCFHLPCLVSSLVFPSSFPSFLFSCVFIFPVLSLLLCFHLPRLDFLLVFSSFPPLGLHMRNDCAPFLEPLTPNIGSNPHPYCRFHSLTSIVGCNP